VGVKTGEEGFEDKQTKNCLAQQDSKKKIKKGPISSHALPSVE